MPNKMQPEDQRSFDKSSAANLTPQSSKTVDEYIARLGDWRGQIVEELRDLVRSTVPKAEECIRWGQPVYDLDGPLCYIKAFRNQVNFGFWRGDLIADPKKLLLPSPDSIRHIKLTSLSQIQKPQFKELLKAAAKLNKEMGDPTKSS